MASQDDRGSTRGMSPGAADVPLPFRRPPLLPKNLEQALRHLGDDELIRLTKAVIAERDRRGFASSEPADEADRHDNSESRAEPSAPAAAQSPPGIEGLTQAQVNLVQAAFKAGVKPSAIARQFAISQRLVQKALGRKLRS